MRNQWGFESIFADPKYLKQACAAMGITDPQIPLWPIAIVGALLLAHVVNGMCKR